MVVRGAPLIGATAAYGMALAMLAEDASRDAAAAYELRSKRPTAVNLGWALERQMAIATGATATEKSRSRGLRRSGADRRRGRRSVAGKSASTART